MWCELCCGAAFLPYWRVQRVAAAAIPQLQRPRAVPRLVESALLEIQELEGGHGDEGKEAGEPDKDERAPADQAVLDAVRHVHELGDAVALPAHGYELIGHCAQLRPYHALNGPCHRVDVIEPAYQRQRLSIPDSSFAYGTRAAAQATRMLLWAAVQGICTQTIKKILWAAG